MGSDPIFYKVLKSGRICFENLEITNRTWPLDHGLQALHCPLPPKFTFNPESLKKRKTGLDKKNKFACFSLEICVKNTGSVEF